jgi:hypothetical protein
MVEFSVTAGECAVLIHDIGEGLRTPGKRLYDPTGASVIAAIAGLADFCRSKKMPFFHAVVGDYRPPRRGEPRLPRTARRRLRPRARDQRLRLGPRHAGGDSQSRLQLSRPSLCQVVTTEQVRRLLM